MSLALDEGNIERLTLWTGVASIIAGLPTILHLLQKSANTPPPAPAPPRELLGETLTQVKGGVGFFF